jgi:hypothetical protein
MEVLTGFQIYGVIAVSISLTGYLRIYKPSISLLEEIIEENSTIYSGFSGFLIWNSFATVLAPLVGFMLLQNDNEEAIQKFAVGLANRILEEEDDE